MSLFFIFFIYLNYISCSIFCPKKNEAPQKIQINKTYTINPVIYLNENYTAIQLGNKVFLNRAKGKFIDNSGTYFKDSEFCPDGFKIPLKEDFESVLKQLGDNAYSNLTDPHGFNMTQRTYYLTNTIGEKTSFSKMFMYLDGKKIKFKDSDTSSIIGNLSQRAELRCMLDFSNIKIEFPNYKGDLNISKTVSIKTNSKALNGYLWKIQDSIYTTETIQHTFSKSGMNKIEFWGSYINGEKVYLCDYAFVKKKPVSSSQEYSDSKIKLIETEFDMQFNFQLHITHSNCPIAPRTNGGYYVAFTDKSRFLHVLSYDRNDKLLKYFNTTEKAYPDDITATDYGFAIYVLDAVNSDHSYISLYNKNFELVNTVQIMNNNPNDDNKIDSNIKKQVIRYDSKGVPVRGMRFMYKPDHGKLIYSRGRIFLIFSHYNYFLDTEGHQGDSMVTFNDGLQDVDYGCGFGTSHSLISSITFDEYDVYTASLTDSNNTEGINILITSKRDFRVTYNDYDPINKKYNYRNWNSIKILPIKIEGNRGGRADGRLGGILYFEKYELYCLVYAKTPKEQNDKKTIYMTTWKNENDKVVNNKTIEIKILESGYIWQVRAGKYGDDKVLILYYNHNSYPGFNDYGSMDEGTIPKLYLINVISLQKIKSDITVDKLLMNSNEDLRTFHDGVLIWAAANKNRKLVINKIGTPLLSENNDDIDYILTKDDLIKDEEDEEGEEEESKSFSTAKKVGIIIGIILGILVFGIYMLLRYVKIKKSSVEINSLDNQKLVA